MYVIDILSLYKLPNKSEENCHQYMQGQYKYEKALGNYHALNTISYSIYVAQNNLHLDVLGLMLQIPSLLEN